MCEGRKDTDLANNGMQRFLKFLLFSEATFPGKTHYLSPELYIVSSVSINREIMKAAMVPRNDLLKPN